MVITIKLKILSDMSVENKTFYHPVLWHAEPLD